MALLNLQEIAGGKRELIISWIFLLFFNAVLFPTSLLGELGEK